MEIRFGVVSVNRNHPGIKKLIQENGESFPEKPGQGVVLEFHHGYNAYDAAGHLQRDEDTIDFQIEPDRSVSKFDAEGDFMEQLRRQENPVPFSWRP